MMEHEIHGKLTGAGGGGCVIGFPKDPKALDLATFERDLTKLGFTVLKGIQKSSEGFKCSYEVIQGDQEKS